MRKYFTFVLFILLLDSPLAAQEEKLIGVADENHRSVLSLLRAKGCKPLWESQAIEDSRISPLVRNSLPVGRVIVLKARSCHLEPPPEVIRASLALRSGIVRAKPKENVEEQKLLELAPEVLQKQTSTPPQTLWSRVAAWWKRTDWLTLFLLGTLVAIGVFGLIVMVGMLLPGRRASKSASARVSVQNPGKTL